MKSAKSANYWQIDNKIKSVFKIKGAIILSSLNAWSDFKWTRKYFKERPEEGYFIWVKEQIDFPIFTCVSILSKNINQNLNNLMVVEKGLNIKIEGTCNTVKKNLCGTHKAKGKVVLRENAIVDYNHIHSWGGEDVVKTNYEFFLGKNTKLHYTYKSLSNPKKLEIATSLRALEDSNASVNIFCNCINTKVNIKDSLFLEERNASGIIKLRLVGRKKSNIDARSTIIAKASGKGHLDCQGLLVDEKSEISLVPELICKNKNAQITHEASIGKISDEELNYLRTRGLSEEESINLIVSGFLDL